MKTIKKLYNELKYHILYDNAKITNKIKDKKKARKNIRAFCVDVWYCGYQNF